MDEHCDTCGEKIKRVIHGRGYRFCSEACREEAYEELKNVHQRKEKLKKQNFEVATE